MKDTKVPESPCPFCGTEFDGAFSFEDKVPSPGDATVCIQCASPLVFDDAMKLRQMTPGEFAGLPEYFKDELRLFQRAVRAIDRRSEGEREAG